MARVFGHVPGVEEGHQFINRMALRDAGVHLPIQAGISGGASEGADSIVLSGGYEDDHDYGDLIVYTGAGGNEGGKQIADQELVRGNLGLALSCDKGLPVRVTRGSKHKSSFSPPSGYQYAGLYGVEDYWFEEGISGFKIWRYRLRKLEKSIISNDSSDTRDTSRVEQIVQRIIRNTQIALEVKEDYKFKCQVCGIQIKTLSGFYAEAAHIQPLGQPHNGPDVKENIICLCPNHHVMFDKGSFSINDDFSLNGISGKLIVLPKHKIGLDFILYHREHWKLVEAEK